MCEDQKQMKEEDRDWVGSSAQETLYWVICGRNLLNPNGGSAVDCCYLCWATEWCGLVSNGR